MRFRFVIPVMFLAFLSTPFVVIAQHQHGGMSGMPGMESEKKAQPSLGNEFSPTRTFLLEGRIKASFSIMPMVEHKKMLQDMKMKVEMDPQATHNIAVMLTDTRTNLPLTDAVVKMKVIDPKGKEQIKLLDTIPVMNQYAQDFSLSGRGKYQILILFKVKGEKFTCGFYYLVK